MRPDLATRFHPTRLKRFAMVRRLGVTATFARGVVGVWPTATYPSHTMLVTGVRRVEHGILNNVEFDPQHEFQESWFWYARQKRQAVG